MCTAHNRLTNLPGVSHGSLEGGKSCLRYRRDLRGAIDLWRWEGEVCGKVFGDAYQAVQVSAGVR
jgi:hypothetical protein